MSRLKGRLESFIGRQGENLETTHVPMETLPALLLSTATDTVHL
jgi:hypothetical protein